MDIALLNPSYKKSKNVAETYAAMVDLEARAIEYRDTIDSPSGVTSLGKIQSVMTDNDTQKKAEDTTKLNTMEYEDFRMLLVEKQERIVGLQGVRVPQAHNNMVDALRLSAGGAYMPDVASVAVAWGGQAADPWSGGTVVD